MNLKANKLLISLGLIGCLSSCKGNTETELPLSNDERLELADGKSIIVSPNAKLQGLELPYWFTDRDGKTVFSNKDFTNASPNYVYIGDKNTEGKLTNGKLYILPNKPNLGPITVNVSTNEETGPLSAVSGKNVKPAETNDLDLTNMTIENTGNIAIISKDGKVQSCIDGASNTTKLVENPLKGQKLSILADSITTYNGYIPSGYAVYYPRYNVKSVEDTWWKKLLKSTEMELGQNCAWSGSRVTGQTSSTTSASCGASKKRVDDLSLGGIPDIIICFIGINDFGQNDPVYLGNYEASEHNTDGSLIVPEDGNINTFSDAYGVMVNKIRKTYPNARVYCCSLLETYHTSYDDDGKKPCKSKKGELLSDWNQRIETIANNLGACFIDLNDCGITYENTSTYMGDKLHPQPQGHTLMAEYVKKALLRDKVLTK